MTQRRRARFRSPGALATLAAACLGMATAGTAAAQAPPVGGGAPQIDRRVQNDHPGFLVRASVDRKHRIYAEGQSLVLQVRCEQDAYLYVLYQQADGKIFQIFPNSGQPDNHIKAMQDVRVPSLDDAFRWVVGAPFGKEVIKVIASKKPVDALSLPGLKQDHFNPVTSEQVAGAGQQLGKQPPAVWSEHDVKIQTVRKGEPTEPPDAHKRVGVFFGVASYEFNEVYKERQREQMRKNEGKVDEDAVRSLSLNKCARDAADMARLLTERGDLSVARVFVNAQATRDKIREMITEWLPSVTQPGDTVFIFFSGHGSQIADDDGDEKDGLDETIDPTDEIGFSVFDELIGRQRKGQLDPALSERVGRLAPQAIAIFQKAMNDFADQGEKEATKKAIEQTHAYLMRTTGISDDEMGHWVQKLDGRRVVVILDACHSGGQTPTGRAEAPQASGKKEAGFDFLTGEFGRLKDLDQPSLTVLAAAAEEETSLELSNLDNGLFTHALLHALRRPAPVDARTANDSVRDEVAEVVAALNQRRIEANRNLPPEKQRKMAPAFTPQLFTTDPQPVYLIPVPAPTDPERTP